MPRWLKPLIFCLALLPLGRQIMMLTSGTLVNPIEWITRSTGTWALVMLLATLAITPLRQLTGRSYLVRLRRMLGLFAFFYAVLHLLIYLVLDQYFDVRAIGHDILKRPFITVGALAWCLLLILAVTSTQNQMRRLGRTWQKLHRLVYVAAILGVLHYWWLVKKDLTQPSLYAAALAILLGWRVLWHWRHQR